MYSHFKKLPSSHKLGALYAIDSVARRWHDLAKTNHQSLDGAASDGTPADAVNKVTELLPGLMDTMVEITPSERKVRLLAHTCPFIHHIVSHRIQAGPEQNLSHKGKSRRPVYLHGDGCFPVR